MAVTQISDIIVPQSFTQYNQVLTEQKTKLIQSGAIARSSFLDQFLAGGGNIVTMPSFKDLTYSESNVSSDSGAASTPEKISAIQAITHRLSRNKSWSTADLAGDLAGADPMQAILNRVSNYWALDLQNLTISTLKGVFASNVTNNSSDMVLDVSGASYVAGTTDFQASTFLDAAALKGDSFSTLSTLFVHSRVYFRMLKENLITFQLDSELNVNVPTYMGFRVVYDDGLPNPSTGVYHSYLLGQGALQLGMGSPKNPTETYRNPSAGNGGGVEELYSRTEFAIHPVGFSYAGTYTGGGATATTLAAAASWTRVYPEKKQVPMIAIVTREH